eukprot:5600005-Pleurochrysis_carterae.AAC.1
MREGEREGKRIASSDYSCLRSGFALARDPLRVAAGGLLGLVAVALQAVPLDGLALPLRDKLVDDHDLVRRRALRAAVGAELAADAAVLLPAAPVAVDGRERHSPVKRALNTR